MHIASIHPNKLEIHSSILPGYEIVNENKNKPANTQGAAYVGDYYKPATAQSNTTITEQPIAPLPPAELPTGYWKRPMKVKIGNGGPFQETGSQHAAIMKLAKATTTKAVSIQYRSSSAHIIWAKPLEMFGGLMGGELSIAGGVAATITVCHMNKPLHHQ